MEKAAQMARARVIFKGRVQGVSFRFFTESAASALGVNGFVKNLPNGTVEALFEGAKHLVEQAIAECKQGPPYAYVEVAEITWESYSGEFRGFSVRR